MGSAPKKVKKAVKKTGKKVGSFVDKKLVEPTEKLVKKVGTEVTDTVLGIDKNDRRGTGPTQSSEPAKSKVEPEKTTAAKKVAMGGDTLAAQRLLMQKNKKFKQTKV